MAVHQHRFPSSGGGIDELARRIKVGADVLLLHVAQRAAHAPAAHKPALCLQQSRTIPVLFKRFVIRERVTILVRVLKIPCKPFSLRPYVIPKICQPAIAKLCSFGLLRTYPKTLQNLSMPPDPCQTACSYSRCLPAWSMQLFGERWSMLLLPGQIAC